MQATSSSLHVCVPSVIVVPPVRPPPPPPVPGTVTFESIRPPADPPLPFLRPWKSHERVEQEPVVNIRSIASSIPCTIEASMLSKFHSRHDVEGTVRAVFVDRDEEFIQQVLQSLESPFAANGDAPVWSLVRSVKPNVAPTAPLGGKKIKTRHRILRGAPWSIVSYGDDGANGDIRRNVVYDDTGNAVAQVDFGHGATLGIHVHGLVHGSLDHAATHDDDHLFRLHAVPWPWMCIPDIRFATESLSTADRDTARHKEQLDSSSDDDGTLAGVGGHLFRLPSLDVDGCHWVSVALPFEDFLGEASHSSEW